MSLLKIIGLLLIVFTGICAGTYASAELNLRAVSIEKMERLIEYISTQIRYTAAPVKEIISQVASDGEFKELPFLQAAVVYIKKGECPSDAWSLAVQKEGGMCGFTVPDRELLLHFGQGLGKSDIEGQLSHCESFHRLLEDRLQAARSDVSVKGKLYMTFGVAGGLSVALLML